MKRSNDILPQVDLSNSREYYGMYNSRDFYKGTSFKMSGEWTPNTHYFNDEYIVDFVSFEGALLSCIRGHCSSSPELKGEDVPKLKRDERGIVTGIEPNVYWSFVLAGTEGPSGKVWVPQISSDGLLTWKQSNATPESFNVKGEKGDPGQAPVISVRKKDNTWVWTSNGEDILDPLTGQPLEAQGPKGETGATGQVYIPNTTLINKKLSFTLSPSAVDPTITVDLSDLKGDDGKTPRFQFDNGYLYYYYEDDRELHPIGNIMGPKGDKGDPGEKGNKGDPGKKGDKGDPGPVQEFELRFDKSIGMTVLYCRTKGTSTWVRLGPVGGNPGKSPKLIREKGDPNTNKDDRILWGYDGVPVSEWTTLCYLEDLKGDENIAYGCPSDFEGGAPPTDKIWYDPCDDAVDQFSITDFLYQAYLGTGGNLNKQDFEKAFANLNNVSGFEVKFASSFEDLGQPTKEKLGKLWLIPASQTGINDLFDEYIVVHSPSTAEDIYMWEKWGSETISVDLSNYYTKVEIDNIRKDLETQIKDVSSIVWENVNN